MITKEELVRIKQGDGLVVESNGIKHYNNANEVLINGHSLTEVLEAAAAYGESKADSPVEIPKRKTCPHCGRSHVITTKVITIGEGRYSEAETVLCLTCGRDLPGEQ